MTKVSDINFDDMNYDDYWSGSWYDEVDENEDGTPRKKVVPPPPKSQEAGVNALVNITKRTYAISAFMWANDKWMFAATNSDNGWDYESSLYSSLRDLLYDELSRRMS